MTFVRRQDLINELRKRLRTARYRSRTARTYEQQQRYEGRVKAYATAIRLLERAETGILAD